MGVIRGALPAAPIAVYPYFDKVQFWLKSPADRTTVARLRRHCGHLHPDDRPARFGQGYRQRLEFKQPDEDALRWIAGQSDVLINRLEVTLDMIYPDQRALEDAGEFLERHLVRRWHGRTQKIKVVGKTRYDAPRGAPNGMVMYPESYSRQTGELFCLHLEWRINNARAARGAGIRAGTDLLRFDHRRFWRERMLLVEIDAERLGRLMRNRRNGTRSRTPDVGRFSGIVTNLDRRRGGVVLKAQRPVTWIASWGSSV